MAGKRKSKQRKKARPQRPVGQPWWRSKAPRPWRACGVLLAASGALLALRLAGFAAGDRAALFGATLFEWNDGRLLGGWLAALIALFLGWGVYRGELISRLAATLFLGLLAAGALMATIHHEGWPLLVSALALIAACAGMGYAMAIWQPAKR